MAVFLDLRRIGSTGGIYADPSVPLSERGTRLLMDVLGGLHDALVDFALARAEEEDMTSSLSLLDKLAEAITQVRVVGEHQASDTRTHEEEHTSRLHLRAGLGPSGPSFGAGAEAGSGDRDQHETSRTVTGTLRHRVHFGEVSGVLQRLVEALPVARVWLLLDEWAAIPLELQPYLADLLRRAVFPVRGITTKIAAIEQRSAFELSVDGTDYIGIEVGADAAADLDLDDYMVFGNDPEAAKLFFRELFFRHVRSQMLEDGLEPPADANEFQRAAFTQRNAFDELVRAAEGVPRDAINVVRLAAQRAIDDPISVEAVRAAARRWYLTDKEKAVQSNPDAAALLHWVIDTVIGERRARAFLLRQGGQGSHPLITELYDARVLHVIKRSVSSRDQPGVRYDVYQLDFGCYVDLVTTTKAPQGLYEAQDEDDGGGDAAAWVEVPADDYRSIRRAILDLDEFEGRPLTLEDA